MQQWLYHFPYSKDFKCVKFLATFDGDATTIDESTLAGKLFIQKTRGASARNITIGNLHSRPRELGIRLKITLVAAVAVAMLKISLLLRMRLELLLTVRRELLAHRISPLGWIARRALRTRGTLDRSC